MLNKSTNALIAVTILLSSCMAIQDALYVASSNDDTCTSVCLNRGKVFCGRTDFTAGYCCSADGCPDSVLSEAPLCSNSVDDDLLKYLVCPQVTNCGQKVFKATEHQILDISINPFETFMTEGDKCSYMLDVERYEAGDAIELSAIDYHKM